MLSEISQRKRQRKTNIVWFHLYVESKKTNEQMSQNRNRVIDTENKQVLARGDGDGGGGGEK